MTCMAFGAPWERRAIFFLGDAWVSHSAFCHFNWWSNKCIHDSSTVKIRSGNSLPSFLQLCGWVVARRKCMALWSSNPLCTNVSFSWLLVSMRWTLAHEIPTTVAITLHEILRLRSRKDFTCSMWRSSFADVGVPLRGVSSISSRPFLMVFIQWWTASYEGAYFHIPSFNDFNTLEHFYPTKHETLLMFSRPYFGNFLVVSPDPQSNNWHHEIVHRCESDNSVTSATHVIFQSFTRCCHLHKTTSHSNCFTFG